MVAVMLLVFGGVVLAFFTAIRGFQPAPPPLETPPALAGPSWTIKYKEDRKTRTIVLPGNDEKEVLKLLLHMGIRYDHITSMTRNM